MTFRLAPLLLLLFGLPLAAQDAPNMEEAQKTLRFIRLAETRKKLELDDEKLLELNALLDVYEETKISLKMRERVLERRVRNTDGEDPEALLDDYTRLRTEQADLELKLIKDVRSMLKPSEAVAFFRFYHAFQREVQRRIRDVQRQRPNRRGANRFQRDN